MRFIDRRTASCVLVLLAVLVGAMLLTAQSYQLQGQLVGNVIDYWPTHQVINGDTQYCVMSTSSTYYADGVTAVGTTTYKDPGGTNHTIPKVICMFNDGNYGGTGGNIVMYSLDVLDMTNAANIATTLINGMSSYGTSSGDTNSPCTGGCGVASWMGKGTSGDTTDSNFNWKSDQPISVGGWIVMPVFRQMAGAQYAVLDLTFIASPDGGKHWCNPNTYFYRGGGAGCDVTNWDANGDAPKCDATATGNACVNAAYTDVAHSGAHKSVEWPGLTPYDGTTGLMQAVKFFQYCGGGDLTSCSGMPNNADNVVYAYGHNGLRQFGYLAKSTAKTMAAILDPAQWQFYSQSSYSPNNPGNGTSWTSAGVQAGAISLWSNRTPQGMTGPFNYSVQQFSTAWGSPALICANSACSYVFYNSGVGPILTTPTPWGPITQVGPVGNGVDSGHVFFHLLPFTANTVNSTPYNVQLMGTWSNYLWYTAQTVTAAVQGNPTTITVPALTSVPNGTGVPVTIAGFANCWTGLNGSVTITGTATPGIFTVPVSTTCALGLGSPTVTGTPSGGSQFWQPFNLFIGPHQGGSELSGNSGARFTMGTTALSFPRNGLKYYFDFFDYNGASYSNNPMVFADIANVPPVGALLPCVSNGASGGCGGNFGYASAAESTGFFSAGGQSQQNGSPLTDLTNPGGAAIVTNTFSATCGGAAGDACWTVAIVAKWDAVTAYNNIFSGGPLFRFANSNGTPSVFFTTDTAGSRQIGTSSAPISAGTWYSLIVTRRNGAIALSGSDPNTVIYVNNVPYVPVFQGGSGGTGVPSYSVGNFTLQPTSGGFNVNTHFAGVGLWGRYMGPDEISRIYAYQKVLAKRRGISLP